MISTLLRSSRLSIGSVLVAVLLLPASVEAQSPQEVSVETLTKGMHRVVEFGADIDRVAVGDPEILNFDILDKQRGELLLLGLKTGRTTLLVWLTSGPLRSLTVSVQPDLSLLANALREIHPSIEIEIAPDREAFVLRGLVPDVSYSRAAENAAKDYLDAGQLRRRESSQPLVQAGMPPSGEAPGIRVEVEPSRRNSVINLIRLETLPPLLEERIQEAIRELGSLEVTVRRIVRGDLINDEEDLLVLEGSVRDQVQLVRVLHLTAHLFLGRELDEAEIEVLADEAGSLAGRIQQQGQNILNNSGGNQLGNVFSFRNVGNLRNRIQNNLARAKAISLAEGRILSFVEVEHLPQVRVNVRIYEVNRTELLAFDPDTVLLNGDFDQPPLNPAASASTIQSDPATVGSFSNTDVQNALSFLGGVTTEQIQVSGSRVAFDTLLNYLESRGIARTLSNPTLTVLSGELARFQAGGQVPIPESFSPAFGTGAESGATPGVFNSVFFEDFGVQLACRPLVEEDGMITLDLATEVSAPDPVLNILLQETTGSETLTTSFSTRSLGTSARLEDGQVLMVGGLIDRNTEDDTSYTPWFAQIPLIGALFQRFEVRDDDLEIVMLLNPTIVHPPVEQLASWVFPETNGWFAPYVKDVKGYAPGDSAFDRRAETEPPKPRPESEANANTDADEEAEKR